MAELKTRRHDGDVDAFLAGIDNENRRNDARRLRALMAEVSGDDGAMWGDSIVGFGTYHYRYASGREGDWFQVGFSPRKRNLVIYLMEDFKGRDALLDRLGQHSTGTACLYVNRLSDVDLEVLRGLVEASVDHARSISED